MDNSYNEDKGFWEPDYEPNLEQQISYQREQSMVESSIQISPSPPGSFVIVDKEESSNLQLLTEPRISEISEKGHSKVSAESVCIPETIEKVYSPTDAVIISAGQGEHIPQSLPYPEQIETLSPIQEPFITKDTIEGLETLKQEQFTEIEIAANGSKIRKTILTVTHIKANTEVTRINGIETERHIIDQIVGREIIEDIIELPPGVNSLDEGNFLIKESKDTTKQSLPDGTWIKRTTKLTKASLLHDKGKEAIEISFEKEPTVHKRDSEPVKKREILSRTEPLISLEIKKVSEPEIKLEC